MKTHSSKHDPYKNLPQHELEVLKKNYVNRQQKALRNGRINDAVRFARETERIQVRLDAFAESGPTAAKRKDPSSVS